jgi:uncharacterized protein
MDGSDANDGIDYPALMRGALLDVVRRVLARAAEHGLPGEHHFYLTFGIAEEGVEAPPALHRQYPDEMTIVLQHQYWNLSVDDAGFSVTLRFAGRPERLVVPWTALRAFADPSADFAFRLQQPSQEAEADAEPEATAPVETEAPAAEPPASPDARTTERGDHNVVDFGAFRRRSDN